MKYCHTLVKYNQLCKGKPSFQIVSSLKFNKIGKKIIKFVPSPAALVSEEQAKEVCTWNAKVA